jgi:hypothetical protein
MQMLIRAILDESSRALESAGAGLSQDGLRGVIWVFRVDVTAAGKSRRREAREADDEAVAKLLAEVATD